ncbi:MULTISPECIES: hypothetical protein [unclassified Pseudomonas]|uniref:hypothetical protein n=1 Tax=unclassified Pseudomonas TaxID=196821 RepID=UPI000A1E17A2|nr:MULTISPECIES: hypothetical protein [unclassified Pseudomonas]
MVELPDVVASKFVTHGELHELNSSLEQVIVKLVSSALDLAAIAMASTDPETEQRGHTSFEELKKAIESLKEYSEAKARILENVGKRSHD